MIPEPVGVNPSRLMASILWGPATLAFLISNDRVSRVTSSSNDALSDTFITVLGLAVFASSVPAFYALLTLGARLIARARR
jgi:hypothetical protein